MADQAKILDILAKALSTEAGIKKEVLIAPPAVPAAVVTDEQVGEFIATANDSATFSVNIAVNASTKSLAIFMYLGFNALAVIRTFLSACTTHGIDQMTYLVQLVAIGLTRANIHGEKLRKMKTEGRDKIVVLAGYFGIEIEGKVDTAKLDPGAITFTRIVAAFPFVAGELQDLWVKTETMDVMVNTVVERRLNPNRQGVEPKVLKDSKNLGVNHLPPAMRFNSFPSMLPGGLSEANRVDIIDASAAYAYAFLDTIKMPHNPDVAYQNVNLSLSTSVLSETGRLSWLTRWGIIDGQKNLNHRVHDVAVAFRAMIAKDFP